MSVFLLKNSNISKKKKRLNKSFVLIIKVLVFSLPFNFAFMYRCYFKSTMSRLHFLSEIAKTTIPQPNDVPIVSKVTLYLNLNSLCVFVHMCVPGLCMFTHMCLHVCLCLCVWVHDFFVHSQYDKLHCVAKNMDSGSSLPEYKSQPCYFLVVWIWASFFNFLLSCSHLTGLL